MSVPVFPPQISGNVALTAPHHWSGDLLGSLYALHPPRNLQRGLQETGEWPSAWSAGLSVHLPGCLCVCLSVCLSNSSLPPSLSMLHSVLACLVSFSLLRVSSSVVHGGVHLDGGPADPLYLPHTGDSFCWF